MRRRRFRAFGLAAAITIAAFLFAALQSWQTSVPHAKRYPLVSISDVTRVLFDGVTPPSIGRKVCIFETCDGADKGYFSDLDFTMQRHASAGWPSSPEIHAHMAQAHRPKFLPLNFNRAPIAVFGRLRINNQPEPDGSTTQTYVMDVDRIEDDTSTASGSLPVITLLTPWQTSMITAAILVIIAWAAIVLLLAHQRRNALVIGSIPCPICGYDVRATPRQCPECGSKL